MKGNPVEIKIDTAIVEGLSVNGTLAYLAVSMAGGTEATTAALAGLVKCKTGNMASGLKELSVAAPGIVSRARNPKTGKLNNHWVCGAVKAGDGVLLQNLDSERYRMFVDDLQKYWTNVNPDLPFEMNGKDGVRIRQFLLDHRYWIQEDWRMALNHRKTSVLKYKNASRSQPIWMWIGRLDEYASGPLNEYGKPVEGNGNGKAAIREEINRQGNAEFLSRHL
jgi:hypothetical protein